SKSMPPGPSDPRSIPSPRNATRTGRPVLTAPSARAALSARIKPTTRSAKPSSTPQSWRQRQPPLPRRARSLRSRVVPRLGDTTIRVLSQEPLAGAMPTGELLRVAEVLDTAGYAYLEVSGGGAFDAAVRRGVESPWERIRAIRARTSTPLMLAVRG